MSFDFKISEQMYLSNEIPDLKLIATDSNGFSSSTLISFTLGHFGFVFLIPFFFSFPLNKSKNNRCESIERLKNEAILELKSYCVSECNDQCKEIIEKYQEMECFEELKDSIGELFTNSLQSCCESSQLICESISNLSTGAIIGIAIGGFVGLLLIIGLIVFIVLKCKSPKNKQSLKHSNDSQIPLQNM